MRGRLSLLQKSVACWREDSELLTASDCRGPVADRRPLSRIMILYTACNVNNGILGDLGIVR